MCVYNVSNFIFCFREKKNVNMLVIFFLNYKINIDEGNKYLN